MGIKLGRNHFFGINKVLAAAFEVSSNDTADPSRFCSAKLAAVHKICDHGFKESYGGRKSRNIQASKKNNAYINASRSFFRSCIYQM